MKKMMLSAGAAVLAITGGIALADDMPTTTDTEVTTDVDSDTDVDAGVKANGAILTEEDRDILQDKLDENGDPVRVRSYAQQMLRPREIGFRFSYDFSMEPSRRRGN